MLLIQEIFWFCSAKNFAIFVKGPIGKNLMHCNKWITLRCNLMYRYVQVSNCDNRHCYWLQTVLSFTAESWVGQTQGPNIIGQGSLTQMRQRENRTPYMIEEPSTLDATTDYYNPHLTDGINEMYPSRVDPYKCSWWPLWPSLTSPTTTKLSWPKEYGWTIHREWPTNLQVHRL